MQEKSKSLESHRKVLPKETDLKSPLNEKYECQRLQEDEFETQLRPKVKENKLTSDDFLEERHDVSDGVRKEDFVLGWNNKVTDFV